MEPKGTFRNDARPKQHLLGNGERMFSPCLLPHKRLTNRTGRRSAATCGLRAGYLVLIRANIGAEHNRPHVLRCLEDGPPERHAPPAFRHFALLAEKHDER